jgi:hypothetical protein
MPKLLSNCGLVPLSFITEDKFAFSSTLSKLKPMARVDRNEARAAYLMLPYPPPVGAPHCKLKLKSKIV